MENSKPGLVSGREPGPAPLERKVRPVKDIVAETTFGVIRDVLGETVLEAFEAFLVEKSISYKSLQEKLDLFCSALDSAFGKDSKTIQATIAGKIFFQLNLQFVPIEGKALSDYVEQADREVTQAKAA